MGAEETSHSLCAVGGGMTAQRTLLALATLLAALGAVCLIAVPLGRAGDVPASDLGRRAARAAATRACRQSSVWQRNVSDWRE